MSRLLENSEQFRNRLKTRNLYAFDDEYPKQSESAGRFIIDSVNSISSIVKPYSGYDMSNSVFGRMIDDRTPLTEIGLVMLGKQFAFTTTKRAATEIIPTIKPMNVFLKGEPVVSLKKNYRITRREDENLFQRFLDITTFYTPTRDNIFDNSSTNLDYLRNTGDFQLDVLASQLNRNIYNNVLYLTEPVLEGRVKDRSVELIPTKTYFTTNYEFTAYDYLYPDRELWANDANFAMQNSYNRLSIAYPDYAPNLDFISENFGKSDITTPKILGDLSQLNDWVDIDTGFSGDDERAKIVWGRDGASANLNKNNNVLRGVSEEEVQTNLSFSNDLENKFKNRKGLLAYTRNLINAKGGQIGDTTRKVFKRGNEITGFNGSGLWRAPENSIPSFSGREGIRQHSSVDAYDRFAKAIRFEGNVVYDGNENSVVYKTVMPKIHPILDKEGQIDNRNMMFAIENLAVIVRDGGENTNFAVIDDEYNTRIPKCEMGQFGGRVMWFPPYNLEFNESTTANFESTVMVGRNEPMYNYMHSERSATVRFSMIMDYPPHLRNYEGINKHKAISEFFAFGGEGVPYELPDPSIPTSRIPELPDPIVPVTPYVPEVPSQTVKIHFPNDVPNNAQIQTVMDLIHKDFEYEMMSNTVGYYSNHPNYVRGSGDGSGTHLGLNFNDVYRAGVVGAGSVAITTTYLDKLRILSNFSQYTYDPRGEAGLSVFQGVLTGGTLTSGGTIVNIQEFANQRPITNLDKLLLEAFSDERNFQVLKIVLTGSATKRFEPQTDEADYNQRLAKRRIDSIKHLLNERFKVLFKKDLTTAGVLVEENNEGSSQSQTTDWDSPEAKKERNVEIRIDRNSNELLIPRELTKEEEQFNNELAQQRQELEDQAQAFARQRDCYMNERGSGDDKGILKGFQSASGRYFYPVFHSQTPEDFHRRLTFLQQCMRQGRALRTDMEVTEDGVLRARNSVFGRQPICVLRIGDFFHTKIVIENLTIDYDEAPWDTNPEGFGMQPMIANVTLQVKLIGGQSLRGPIDVLQNAVSFNHYANSTFVNQGTYRTPSGVEAKQYGSGDAVTTENEDNTEATNEERNITIPTPLTPLGPPTSF